VDQGNSQLLEGKRRAEAPRSMYTHMHLSVVLTGSILSGFFRGPLYVATCVQGMYMLLAASQRKNKQTSKLIHLTPPKHYIALASQ
jgi:hypothetical protein